MKSRMNRCNLMFFALYSCYGHCVMNLWSNILHIYIYWKKKLYAKYPEVKFEPRYRAKSTVKLPCLVNLYQTSPMTVDRRQLLNLKAVATCGCHLLVSVMSVSVVVQDNRQAFYYSSISDNIPCLTTCFFVKLY